MTCKKSFGFGLWGEWKKINCKKSFEFILRGELKYKSIKNIKNIMHDCALGRMRRGPSAPRVEHRYYIIYNTLDWWIFGGLRESYD